MLAKTVADRHIAHKVHLSAVPGTRAAADSSSEALMHRAGGLASPFLPITESQSQTWSAIQHHCGTRTAHRSQLEEYTRLGACPAGHPAAFSEAISDDEDEPAQELPPAAKALAAKTPTRSGSILGTKADAGADAKGPEARAAAAARGARAREAGR